MNDGTDGPPTAPTTGRSPYDEYVQASVLNSLQQPLTNSPDEMAFIVVTQVQELWFTLIVHEWRAAREAFAKDDLPAATDALVRSRRALQSLTSSWTPIAALTPPQFNGFRAAFGRASGFQSAMYRHLEFLLGEKSAGMLRAHRGDPKVHDALAETFRESSLYDEVLLFLKRRGRPVPDLAGRATEPGVADPAVTEVWRQIYRGPRHDPLVALGELLTDIAELVARWRQDHVMVVRRAMGARTGSAGSSGLAWLTRRAERMVFPELWEARDDI